MVINMEVKKVSFICIYIDRTNTNARKHMRPVFVIKNVSITGCGYSYEGEESFSKFGQQLINTSTI